jgi:hypothetical protein
MVYTNVVHSGTKSNHALNFIRPRMLPQKRSGVIAAKTNWKYASVAVGKWNGMRVFAPDTAWFCSPK